MMSAATSSRRIPRDPFASSIPSATNPRTASRSRPRSVVCSIAASLIPPFFAPRTAWTAPAPNAKSRSTESAGGGIVRYRNPERGGVLCRPGRLAELDDGAPTPGQRREGAQRGLGGCGVGVVAVVFQQEPAAEGAPRETGPARRRSLNPSSISAGRIPSVKAAAAGRRAFIRWCSPAIPDEGRELARRRLNGDPHPRVGHREDPSGEVRQRDAVVNLFRTATARLADDAEVGQQCVLYSFGVLLDRPPRRPRGGPLPCGKGSLRRRAERLLRTDPLDVRRGDADRRSNAGGRVLFLCRDRRGAPPDERPRGRCRRL